MSRSTHTSRRASALISNNRLLDRFQLVLLAVQRESFYTGAQPFQDAALVVNVRNELVHFRPPWRAGGGGREDHDLERRLRAKRLTTSPFTGAGNPYFPDKALSSGLAEWAWSAALAFGDAFYDGLGVSVAYMNWSNT